MCAPPNLFHEELDSAPAREAPVFRVTDDHILPSETDFVIVNNSHGLVKRRLIVDMSTFWVGLHLG
jgi:hypothetical protein